MTARPTRSKPSLAPVLVEGALAAAVFVLSLSFIWFALGTIFRSWDDEGYMLLSLRGYLAGHPLYLETYTQYGPFPYLAQAIAYHLLQLPVTHDAGRLMALLAWILLGSFGGLFVYRISRHLLLSAAALASCVVLGFVFVNEPGHPQQFICPLFMLSALAAAWTRRRPNASLFLLGAIGSALVFTKVNIGGFYFIALTQTCLALVASRRLRNAGIWALTAAATALPFLLMRANWAGVAGYCASATLCIGATFAANRLVKTEGRLPWRAIGWGIAGSVAASAVVLIASIAQGISPAALLNGVLLEPIRQPRVFTVPYGVSFAAVLFTICMLAASGRLVPRALRGFAAADQSRLDAIGCALGLLVIILVVAAPAYHSWAMPFLPFAVIRLGTGRPWHDVLPRLFLANLAAMQYLGQYPVAGSQMSIAASPLLLVGFGCVADGAAALAVSIRNYWQLQRHTLLRVAAGLLLLLAASRMVYRGFRPHLFRYPASHLAGSASLHLDPATEARFEYLAASVHRNCDVLFTMPGMASFNFWSGVPAPNNFNATAWIDLFRPESQRAILRILQAHPSSCVIYNPENLRFWNTSQASIEASPLAMYILKDMRTTADRDGYEIRVNPERQAAWTR